MSNKSHGMSIGIESVGDEVFLSIKAVGKLTHADYQIITPLIDGALGAVKEPKVKMLMDATELDGWELRAAWDDLKLGLKHGSDFQKVAIVGNQRWQDLAAKVGSWFLPGEARSFEGRDAALTWLAE